MAKITRIKASDPREKKPVEEAEVVEKRPLEASETPAASSEKLDRAAVKAKRKAEKAEKKAAKEANKKPQNKFVRVITAPGRYLKESWAEIRQVRWPNRKATWKMVLAIFAYTALFIVLIMLLDVFFTWLFNLILGS